MQLEKKDTDSHTDKTPWRIFIPCGARWRMENCPEKTVISEQ